jgi:hypothetical protein
MTIRPDVVIAYHSKDRILLPFCVKGVQNNIQHENIYVVSAEENKTYIESVGAIWVNEDTLIDGLSIHSYTNTRWGWYFQQFLKLSMADFVNTDYYLVIDSDTIFLRKVNFFNNQGRPLYVTADEYHLPYFKTFTKLFTFQANRDYSFITHHMIFSKKIVKEMYSQIKGDGKWYFNILSVLKIDHTLGKQSNFSEYETYGHFLKEKHPEEVNLRKLMWANVPYLPNKYINFRLASVFDYCNFHHYQLEGFHSTSIIDQLRYYIRFEMWLKKQKNYTDIIYNTYLGLGKKYYDQKKYIKTVYYIFKCILIGPKYLWKICIQTIRFLKT